MHPEVGQTMCTTAAISQMTTVASLAAAAPPLGDPTHSKMSDLLLDLSDPGCDELGGSF